MLRHELHSMVNFVTFYMTMDTYNPPFDDLRVRKAFAHSIDRTALMDSALKDVGVAAYSMLAPGFPGSRPDVFRNMMSYDPERASALLAEAGYPDGKGFPPGRHLDPRPRFPGHPPARRGHPGDDRRSAERPGSGSGSSNARCSPTASTTMK